MDIEKLKSAIVKDIDSRKKELGALSGKLHANPETAMMEQKAVAWLKDILEANEFYVETGIYKLPTAFRAVYGKGKPVIGFLAEYDALPKLGHACGHNLIATATVAAGIASKLIADAFKCTVIIYGTPGEEGDAGKALMAERGAFRDLDVAMICHPGGGNEVVLNALACQTLNIEYIGKAAHAAAEPESGINALEALIIGFNAVNSLRQHIKDKARIHGIITDGGEAPNIVPAHTAATFLVRATNNDYLNVLKEKVLNCFAGAAISTGATLKYKWADVCYEVMNNNITLAKLFRKNMQEVGRSIALGSVEKFAGSSDVGNVSSIVPTIQPYVAIAPDDVLIHSTEFEKATGTKEALNVMLDAAKSMAMTAADLVANPDTFRAVRGEFDKSK